MAAVERMPRLAERVTAMGLVRTWDHIAPVFVLDQRAMSGYGMLIYIRFFERCVVNDWLLTWLVIKVAVFPIPELIAYTKNQPHPLAPEAAEVSSRWARPMFPPVFTMQNMKSPQMAGSITIDLNQKKLRS